MFYKCVGGQGYARLFGKQVVVLGGYWGPLIGYWGYWGLLVGVVLK